MSSAPVAIRQDILSFLHGCAHCLTGPARKRTVGPALCQKPGKAHVADALLAAGIAHPAS